MINLIGFVAIPDSILVYDWWSLQIIIQRNLSIITRWSTHNLRSHLDSETICQTSHNTQTACSLDGFPLEYFSRELLMSNKQNWSQGFFHLDTWIVSVWHCLSNLGYKIPIWSQKTWNLTSLNPFCQKEIGIPLGSSEFTLSRCF